MFKKPDSPLISQLVTLCTPHDAQLNLSFLQGYVFVDLKSEAEVQRALKRKKECLGKGCLFLLFPAAVDGRVLSC